MSEAEALFYRRLWRVAITVFLIGLAAGIWIVEWWL